ncbi:MAG: hypothetical protein M3P83_00030 [Actinomycetota bacterium]|nr:hypothetical protein [Actinomycetota bacterium]
MSEVLALPARGEVFLDVRGSERALRLTWHHETHVVVLSLWRQGTCAGTFRLAVQDVPQFIDALVSGLALGYAGGVGEGSPQAR